MVAREDLRGEQERERRFAPRGREPQGHARLRRRPVAERFGGRMKEGVQRVKEIVATFSIVGFDPETDSLGVAVQSKFLAVGAVVPWTRAGVGAVATQALANVAYGPDGLALLERGHTAQQTLDALLAGDE